MDKMLLGGWVRLGLIVLGLMYAGMVVGDEDWVETGEMSEGDNEVEVTLSVDGNESGIPDTSPPKVLVIPEVLGLPDPEEDIREQLMTCRHSPAIVVLTVTDRWAGGAALDFHVTNLHVGQRAGTIVMLQFPYGCDRNVKSGYGADFSGSDGGYVQANTSFHEHGFGFSLEFKAGKLLKDCMPTFLGIDGEFCNHCGMAGLSSYVRPGENWETRAGITTTVGGIEKVPTGTTISFTLPSGCTFSDGWGGTFSHDGQQIEITLDSDDGKFDMIVDKGWKVDPAFCFPRQFHVVC
mmetsp:Transcript_10071/g.20373  ORF Transcript_10071/g.20373 Transcript_10071/m.20373 type:complete len:293 (-) Transcript_10071:100-978(-)